jgi:hypothetical protein
MGGGQVYSDAGVSGAKDRKQRPGLDRMLSDASRGKFDVVMAWAIDHVGRSLIDLLGTIQHLEACGVDLYLDQQNIDTTTPMGKLIFQISGAFAEFERSMIRQHIHAGLQRARKAGKVLGRARIDPAIEAAIRRSLKKAAVSGRRRGRWVSGMGRFKGSRGNSPKANEKAAGSLGDWHVRSYFNCGCAKTRVATPASGHFRTRPRVIWWCRQMQRPWCSTGCLHCAHRA